MIHVDADINYLCLCGFYRIMFFIQWW